MNKNPKYEYRNPKQIQNSNIKITSPHSFEHYDFGFVSNFGFRNWNLTWRFACMKTTHRTLFFLSIALTFLFYLNSLSLAQDKPDFAALKGRWVRPDGGYVIEIRSVGAGGQMQAAYFNPNPINVSQAEAKQSGAAVTVFIELRGPGYPGSTYTLIYDPKSDLLKGVYHQAVLQQDFDVVFVRSRAGQ
jgi:uncharacterized protein (DUF2147 family)